MTDAQRGAVFIGLLEGIYYHIDVVVLVPAVLYIILVLLVLGHVVVLFVSGFLILSIAGGCRKFELYMKVVILEGVETVIIFIALI